VSVRCWEDAIAPTDISDVIAARDAALAEQRALVLALRSDGLAYGDGPAYAPQWTSAAVLDLRERLGLSRQEMGERIGYSDSAIGFWERGQSKPGIEVIPLLDELERESRECSVTNADDEQPWSRDRIRALRNDLGMTQREFAELVGLKTSALKNWEQGVSKPRAEFVRRLIEIDHGGVG